MDEIPEARELPKSALEAAVQTIDPTWELREAVPAERGFCSVYRLVVADSDSTQELYLKASPDGRPWSIPTEARLQAVLESRTSIPVPEVLAVTDAHETLPSPHYLMRGLPGEDVAYEHVARLEDDALRRLAREMGAYLADLHSVPATEAFGHVRHDGPELAGEQPSSDPTALTVGDPSDDWPAYLREYVTEELERHADSRFSHLTPELRRWLESGIDDLTGPFEPVLGRNDHGLHNLLVDPETGEITAVLDWGYTLSVPAAFDFEFAVYLYSGAFLAGLPDARDRRMLVREAMLEGYRTTAPDRVAEVATPEPLYEAAAMLRIMNDFDHLDLPVGTEEAVKDRIMEDVRDLLE
ncbi:phosphotransferase family protein [Natronobacterium texcoconense]|uniref:Predicted kinase, aminoglycoside phosphotransferase (APT) family n=1 Tax=Natronobacterium texcoconense TaxID=1095778 RepID=A0A1H1IYE1_NATTX|nr:phosphotransferase [Natronobacterium texcoconense]SDR42721.1 Predicted kinase, aminoglycoside phosphotransferase (APT) family [Natronobacterium texcoconense]